MLICCSINISYYYDSEISKNTLEQGTLTDRQTDRQTDRPLKEVGFDHVYKKYISLNILKKHIILLFLLFPAEVYIYIYFFVTLQTLGV